jgi:hypothetical protein
LISPPCNVGANTKTTGGSSPITTIVPSLVTNLRYFVRWHGPRHPRDMGVPEVQAFLTMLASERHVSSSTHNQALSAVLFLYRGGDIGA